MHTIIFDFGNVVGFFDHYRTLARLAPHTDLAMEALYRDIYQGELEDSFERGAMTPAAFLARVKDLAGFRCDEQFLAEAIADIFWPNPEVCDLLPALKKHHRLLLGSNTNVIHSTKFLHQFAEVLTHFDGLVLSHEIRARKPEPGFYQHCQRLAQAPAEHCLFIDDLPANIAGAKQCGMRGLVYQPKNDLVGRLREMGVAI